MDDHLEDPAELVSPYPSYYEGPRLDFQPPEAQGRELGNRSGRRRHHDVNCTLWVGNLDYRVTDTIVRELFLQVGPIQSVVFPRPKDDCKNGAQGYNYCFVNFFHPNSVPRAIQILQDTVLFGRKLNLKCRPDSIHAPPPPTVPKEFERVVEIVEDQSQSRFSAGTRKPRTLSNAEDARVNRQYSPVRAPTPNLDHDQPPERFVRIIPRPRTVSPERKVVVVQSSLQSEPEVKIRISNPEVSPPPKISSVVVLPRPKSPPEPRAPPPPPPEERKRERDIVRPNLQSASSQLEPTASSASSSAQIKPTRSTAAKSSIYSNVKEGPAVSAAASATEDLQPLTSYTSSRPLDRGNYYDYSSYETPGYYQQQHWDMPTNQPTSSRYVWYNNAHYNPHHPNYGRYDPYGHFRNAPEYYGGAPHLNPAFYPDWNSYYGQAQGQHSMNQYPERHANLAVPNPGSSWAHGAPASFQSGSYSHSGPPTGSNTGPAPQSHSVQSEKRARSRSWSRSATRSHGSASGKRGKSQSRSRSARRSRSNSSSNSSDSSRRRSRRRRRHYSSSSSSRSRSSSSNKRVSSSSHLYYSHYSSKSSRPPQENDPEYDPNRPDY